MNKDATSHQSSLILRRKTDYEVQTLKLYYSCIFMFRICLIMKVFEVLMMRFSVLQTLVAQKTFLPSF